MATSYAGGSVNKRTPDPLMFAYVYLDLMDEEEPRDDEVYRVFYVDAHKIRVRQITLESGREVEGPNLWLPWSSIRSVRER
jgi:hypothetical protein